MRRSLQVQKIPHEFVRRVFPHLFRSAGLLDDSFVDDDHSIGNLEGLVLVVGHKDGGEADPFVEFPEPAAEVFAHLGIQRAERLVEQEHFGLDGEGSRKGDPLALAAGELRGKALFEPVELDGREEFLDPGADRRFRRPLLPRQNPQREGDVFKNIHVREEGVGLKNEARLALVGGEPRDIAVLKQHRSLRLRKLQPGDHAEQGGFSRTAGAEQGDQLAGLDLDAHVVERGVAGKPLGDVMDSYAHGKVAVVRVASTARRRAIPSRS